MFVLFVFGLYVAYVFPDHKVNLENIKILGYFWEYAWLNEGSNMRRGSNKTFQTLSRIVHNSKGYKI